MQVRQPDVFPEEPLTELDKGVSAGLSPIAPAATAKLGWNVLREDLPLPLAVIRQAALDHNRSWMRAFLSKAGVDIAPHGKTTMSPSLFDMQFEDGAWAITVATPHQIRVARAFGHQRIFYANQLVGRAAIRDVLTDLRDDPHFEFFCLVDHAANVRALAEAAAAAGLGRPLNVLVEMGFAQGRTGCRTVAEGLALARQVKAHDGVLALAGVEGFEGLITGASDDETSAKVTAFLDSMVEVARHCAAESLFSAETVLLTAGGSAQFDAVARVLGSADLGRPTRVLIRSGCYITHDSVLYARAMEAMRARNPEVARAGGGLQPALEVWAYVQSRPEPGKAIVSFGKRDCSYDDYPVALWWYRPDGSMAAPRPVPGEHTVTGLNDQHCHVALPEDSPLEVGDLVGFGISHPCLTFDKWRVLHLVDESYTVIGSLRTYF